MMAWRNPWPRGRHHGDTMALMAHEAWSKLSGRSQRIRAGARHACARLRRERDEALERVEQQTDWYQQRYNAERRWVETEVRPLSDDVAHRYYSVIANGSPAPHERADWTDTMHGLRLRAERAERERDTARRNLAALEWMAPRGYPFGRGADGRVSARYDLETLEPEWHDSWAECATAMGWEG